MAEEEIRLTPEQEAKIPEHVRKWIKIAQNTEPTNFNDFRKHAMELFKKVDLPWRDNVIACYDPSTLACLGPVLTSMIETVEQAHYDDFAVALDGIDLKIPETPVAELDPEKIIESTYRVTRRVMALFFEIVKSKEYLERDKAGPIKKAAALKDEARLLFSKPVTPSVEVYETLDIEATTKIALYTMAMVADGAASFLAELKDLNKGGPNAELVEDVARNLEATIAKAIAVDGGAAITNNWSKLMGGQWWISWQVFADFYEKELGGKLEGEEWEKDKAYGKLQRDISFWWPHADFLIAVDRPEEVHVRPRNASEEWGPQVLDNREGPVIKFRNGWSLWRIDGFSVPRHAVMAPETITIDEIKSEQNAELRRILMEQYGMVRYLTDSGAEMVDCDFEGAEVGAEPRALFRDDNGDLFLLGTDGSTGRVYAMPVEDVSTCVDAHEQICGFSEFKIVLKS